MLEVACANKTTRLKTGTFMGIFHITFFGGNLSCGLYYKPMTIVNDDSSIVNKLEASLTDDARVIIYDRHMFIVQATVVL